MIVNAIAIIETNTGLPDLIAHLVKAGFYTKWKSGGDSNDAFTLPSNCVWKRFEVPTELATEPAVVLNDTIALVSKELTELNKARTEKIELLKILVVPSKPWASIKDKPAQPTEEDIAFEKFKNAYPDTAASYSEIRAVFDKLRNKA